MSSDAGLDLTRPRDVSALIGDAGRVYFRNLGTFLAIAAAVVFPVELIVSGLGLEQLFSDFDESPEVGEQAVPLAVSYLVTTPLVTAMTVNAVLALGDGRPAKAGPAIAAGLEAFTPIFLAVVMAGLGILLGLALLVLPGIYLAVRWYFVPQSVVVRGARGLGALRASWDLVAGSWWRTFGVGLLAIVISSIPAALIVIPFRAAADGADSGAVELAGSMVGQTVAGPFLALVGTLLYFDLNVRRRQRP